MKKLLLLFALVGAVFFPSCENSATDEQGNETRTESSTALAGTTWEGWTEFLSDFDGGGGRMEYEMAFTSTTVDFSCTDLLHGEEETTWGFTGTYVYVPPTVTITVTSPENLKGLISTGTIEAKLIEGEEKEGMGIGIHRNPDFIELMGLIKQ